MPKCDPPEAAKSQITYTENECDQKQSLSTKRLLAFSLFTAEFPGAQMRPSEAAQSQIPYTVHNTEKEF